jgi:hypothetical protein
MGLNYKDWKVKGIVSWGKLQKDILFFLFIFIYFYLFLFIFHFSKKKLF